MRNGHGHQADLPAPRGKKGGAGRGEGDPPIGEDQPVAKALRGAPGSGTSEIVAEKIPPGATTAAAP